jgi:hypothetical protein
LSALGKAEGDVSKDVKKQTDEAVANAQKETQEAVDKEIDDAVQKGQDDAKGVWLHVTIYVSVMYVCVRGRR